MNPPATYTKIPASIDLGGAAHFGDEDSQSVNKPFSFTVTNNTGSNQLVYLTGCYLPTNSNRIITDGSIVYATGKTDLSAASTTTHTIAEFLEWIKWKPTRVSFLQITSDNSLQIQQQITIQEKSLYGNPQPINLALSAFTSPNYLNDKMIIVKRKGWQLDYFTEVSLTIPGSGGSSPVATNTTFNFYFGAHLDFASSLKKAAQAAGK